MRKLKLFSALMCLFIGIGQMWADATFVSANEAATSAKNGISLTVTSGSLASGDYYRIDKGATLTISSESGNIESIVFTCTTAAYAKLASHSPEGTYSEDDTAVSWEGSASSVTFTAKTGSSNKNFRFSQVVITTASSGPAKPTVSLDPDGGNFTGSVEVTITPSTGATAYYTTDATKKTSPSTTTWTAYNGSAKPTFTETTTIWVAAVKDATWSDVVEKTFTKVTPVTSYDIDFETNDLSLYVNWDFTNIGIRSTIARHGGDYYGANVNSGGNGTTTCNITTKSKIAAPGTLTFYISKESGNTTASSWKAEVSSDGSDWTEVETFDAKSMSSGTWNECIADLSAYSDVYVRISYGSSSAIRTIDDISLVMASGIAKPTITGEDNFLTSTEVTMSCTTDGAAIYYTTTESAKATPATSGDWKAYDNSNKPSFSATTTVWAAAKKNDAWSAVAEKTFTKATILTVAEALTIIEGLDNKTATTAEYYVSGVVSTVTALTVGGTGEYYISADGTKTSELQVYKGKWVGGANFTSTNQLIEGDDVTIKGKLKKYNSYKELDQNNEVVLYKLKARLAWSEESYEADLSSSNTYPSLTNTNGVSVSYSSSNTDAATINPSTGAISLVAVGSTTIKATFTGNETYKANEVSYTLTVSNSVLRADISFEENGGSDVADLTDQSNLPDPLPTITKAGYNFGGWWTTSDFQAGTEAVAGDAVTSTDPITLYAKWDDPYTVTKALEIIDGLADNGETGNVYVSGIVCTAPSSLLSGGYLTYYISVDGTETNRLQVYKGKDENNEAFTDKDDVQKDDQVVVYGPLMKYVSGTTTKPEFNTGNYLYSLSRKVEAGIEWGVASFDAYIGESNTFPTLTNPNSLTVAYSSSNETAATIDPATGAITLGTTPNVNTTITASFAGNSSYKAAEVSYTLNVYNPTNPGTITYEENGGSIVTDVTTPVDNFPDPLPEPTKENYIFAGWWTTSTFNDGTQAVAGAPMDGNVILYAKWTEIPVWAYTYTSNVTLSTEGGTSASAAKVKFYGEEGDGYDAIKAGTGSTQGEVVVNVPAGATALHFHAYSWYNETVELTVTAPTGVTVTPSEAVAINKNSGISGSSSTYTLAEGSAPQLDAYYAVSLSGNTEPVALTISATSGKRFVLFGVNQEGGLVLESIAISGTASILEYNDGDNFNPAGLVVTGHYSNGSDAPISEGIDWTFDPDPLTEGTTSVSVTATVGEISSDAFVVNDLTVNGAAPISPWASVYTSNVVIASNTEAHVTINEENFDAAKTSKGASATITLPQGVTTIHLHLVAWNGEAQTVSVTGDCFNEAKELNIEANAGVSGSGTTYVLGESGVDYYFSLTPDNAVAANEVITITAASGKRFVLFGVNQEGGVLPVLQSLAVSGDLENKTYEAGAAINPAGLTVMGTYTLGGTPQAPVDVTDQVEDWLYDALQAGDETVTISAKIGTVTSAGYEISGLTVTDPTPRFETNPTSYISFGSKEQGATITARDLEVTLVNVSNASVEITGTGAAAFSVDEDALTGNATLHVSASSANVGTFAATLTISDEAGVATDKEISLSLTVTAPVVEETAVSTTSEWIAATDADLLDGAEVLITGATGGVTYAIGVQNDNNRAAVAGTLSEGIFTPGENTMSFTLVAQEGGTFALQASNGEYLYAASSSKNYLKRQATIDDNAKWTLTATSAIANGTNTNETLRFNSSNNPKIFSCYADETKQSPIQFYVPKPVKYTVTFDKNDGSETTSVEVIKNEKVAQPADPIRDGYTFNYWTLNAVEYDFDTPVTDNITLVASWTENTPTYTEVRNGLNAGEYYTMCLDKAVTDVQGGTIWRVLSKAQSSSDIILEEVEGTLDAGRPYIFYATAATLEVAYTGDAVLVPVTEGNNGLVGSFTQKLIEQVATNYIIYNNELYYVNSNNVYVGANRAYLDMTGVPAYSNELQQGNAPRRRVTMAVHGPQVATGMDALNASDAPVKVLINGQLFIIRGEKMFDAKGQLVK